MSFVPVPGQPQLVITEQPKQRGMRFRYECEGRSAGSIPGRNSSADKKTWPTCTIANYTGKAHVRVSLVSKDERPRPHPHSLVGKDCDKGICQVNIGPETHMQAMFSNLGIQCVKRKDVKSSVQDRLNLKIDPFHTAMDGEDRNVGDIDLNIVRLCFEAWLVDEYDRMYRALDAVVSDPIYDKKATCSALLRICRYDRSRGSCRGGDEVFLLCDKVQKEDISIVFYETGTKWEAIGEFSATDVHRQVAIVFRTPPYRTQNLDRDSAEVKFRLVRPSDSEASDPKTYTYLAEQHGVRKRFTPHWHDQEGVKKHLKTSILGKSVRVKHENMQPKWNPHPLPTQPQMSFGSYASPTPVASVNETFSTQNMNFQYRQDKSFRELLNENDDNVLDPINPTVTFSVHNNLDLNQYKDNMSFTNVSLGQLVATADVSELTSSLKNISIDRLLDSGDNLAKPEPPPSNSRTPFPQQQISQYTQPHQQQYIGTTYVPPQTQASQQFNPFSIGNNNNPPSYMSTTTYHNQLQPQPTNNTTFTSFPASQTHQDQHQLALQNPEITTDLLHIPSDLDLLSVDMDNSSLVNQLLEKTT